MSPTVLLAAMLAAVHAQHSVHYVSTSVSHAATVSVVADAGTSQGIQRIRFTHAGKTGHVTVIVANRTAYFRGDAYTLHWYLGIPAGRAQRFAGDWVRIPHSARPYATVSEAVTLPSLASSLVLSGTLRKVAGGIGNATADRTVTVEIGTDKLPTHVSGIDGGADFGMTFGRWNTPVHVAVPPKSVPVSEILNAPPGA